MDRPQDKSINADVKPVSLKTKIAAAVMAAAVAVSPFTIQSEGTKHKAYLDPKKIPTICNGHTRGVKMGDVATDAQCEAYQQQDMDEHMNLVLTVNPELVDHHNELMAAGDFTFNSGIGAWSKSPMSVKFKQGKFVEGCNSFLGYYTGITVPKPLPGLICKPSASKSGKFVCQLNGLVTRRVNEKKICLTGKWK